MVKLYRVIGLSLLAAFVLSACSSSLTTPTPIVLPTRAPIPFSEAVEMQVQQADAVLPDGPATGIIAAYGTASAGSDTLLACALETTTIRCMRYPVALSNLAAGLVQLDGQVNSGQLTVRTASTFAWDEASQRAAAEAKLADIAPLLTTYDWSSIALADYVESSAWFNPDAERLKAIPLELYGYDLSNDWVIWRGQGWEMPQDTRITHRFPVVYIMTDPTQERPAEALVTIEGTTEEQ
ncbi:MAG: hypothetical protein WAZ19_03655 [Anaerolineae bacterium]